MGAMPRRSKPRFAGSTSATAISSHYDSNGRNWRSTCASKSKTFNPSEVALSSECTPQCAQKVLDNSRHCQRRDVTTTHYESPAQTSSISNTSTEFGGTGIWKSSLAGVV
jgi:hypothetical protein